MTGAPVADVGGAVSTIDARVPSPCVNVCRIDAGTGCAKAASARSTRSRPGRRSTTTTSARVWRELRERRKQLPASSANAARPPDEAADVLARPDLAVLVPRVRAPAAGAAGAVGRSAIPAGAVRRPAQALGPEGSGRDRPEARLDLSPDRVAGAPARHRVRDAGGAPVQPAAAAAAGVGLRAVAADAEPLRLRDRAAPRLARRRGRPTMPRGSMR